MFKYIEITNTDTQEVVKRFDVTGKSERSIEKLDDAIQINLNHDKYCTIINDSPIELPK